MLQLATLCYIKHDGKTLMVHRNKKPNDMHAGKWNGLGGKFETGETPEACAIREIEEESGLAVTNPRLRGLLTFPAFSDDVDWYAFVFTVEITDEQFHSALIDSPEGDLRWIDDADLFSLNLWEGDEIFMRWLERDAFFSARFDYVDGRLTSHEVVFYPDVVEG